MASPILSVTGRASCPGFILVEAQLISDIHSLSPGIDNIYPRKATVIPPEIVLDYLGGQMSIWTPQAPGWVRLAKFPYRGDLAFIDNVDSRTLCATLLVVPRIDYILPEDRAPSRSKNPPPQAFFNAPAVHACFGEESVEKRNSVFIFDKRIFVDGLLQTNSNETTVILENTTPTSEELYWFHRSSRVPARWLDTTLDLIRQHTIQVGNKVKVLSGAHRGAIADIMNIDGTAIQLEVSTSLLAPKVTFSMSISDVRKHISVGDEVVVTAGPHARTTGWVIAVGDSNVQLFDHKASQHVRYFRMTPVQTLITLLGKGTLILCRIPAHRGDPGDCAYNSTTGIICQP